MLQLEDNKCKSVIKTVKISETKSARKAKLLRNPWCLDPDFRREWESVKTKLGIYLHFLQASVPWSWHDMLTC